MSIQHNIVYRRPDLLNRLSGVSGYERSDRTSDLVVSVDKGLERLGEGAQQHRLVDVWGFAGSPFGIVCRALPHVCTIGCAGVPGLVPVRAPATLALDSPRQSQTRQTVGIGVNSTSKPSVSIGIQAVPSTSVEVSVPRFLPGEYSLGSEVLQHEVRQHHVHPGPDCHLGFELECAHLILLHLAWIVVLHTRSKAKDYQVDDSTHSRPVSARSSCDPWANSKGVGAKFGSQGLAERSLFYVD